MCRSLSLGELMFSQYFPRPQHDIIGQTCQLGDFNSVTAIRRPRFDSAQECNPATPVSFTET